MVGMTSSRPIEIQRPETPLSSLSAVNSPTGTSPCSWQHNQFSGPKTLAFEDSSKQDASEKAPPETIYGFDVKRDISRSGSDCMREPGEASPSARRRLTFKDMPPNVMSMLTHLTDANFSEAGTFFALGYAEDSKDPQLLMKALISKINRTALEISEKVPAANPITAKQNAIALDRYHIFDAAIARLPRELQAEPRISLSALLQRSVSTELTRHVMRLTSRAEETQGVEQQYLTGNAMRLNHRVKSASRFEHLQRLLRILRSRNDPNDVDIFLDLVKNIPHQLPQYRDELYKVIMTSMKDFGASTHPFFLADLARNLHALDGQSLVENWTTLAEKNCSLIKAARLTGDYPTIELIVKAPRLPPENRNDAIALIFLTGRHLLDNMTAAQGKTQMTRLSRAARMLPADMRQRLLTYMLHEVPRFPQDEQFNIFMIIMAHYPGLENMQGHPTFAGFIAALTPAQQDDYMNRLIANAKDQIQKNNIL